MSGTANPADYVEPPSKKRVRGPKRHFTVSLDADLCNAVAAWAHQENFSSMSQAMAALIRVAMAAHPDLVLMDVVRAKAYYETKGWVAERLFAWCKETMRLLEVGERP